METILSAVLWLEQQWGNFWSRMVTGFETTVYVVSSPFKSFFEEMVPWKQPMDFLNDFLKLESFYGRFFGQSEMFQTWSDDSELSYKSLFLAEMKGWMIGISLARHQNKKTTTWHDRLEGLPLSGNYPRTLEVNGKIRIVIKTPGSWLVYVVVVWHLVIGISVQRSRF